MNTAVVRKGRFIIAQERKIDTSFSSCDLFRLFFYKYPPTPLRQTLKKKQGEKEKEERWEKNRNKNVII